MSSRDNHLSEISQETPHSPITKISLKIDDLKFYWNIPGANELNLHVSEFFTEMLPLREDDSCTVIKVHAMRLGNTELTISYSRERVRLQTSITIAAYKPLQVRASKIIGALVLFDFIYWLYLSLQTSLSFFCRFVWMHLLSVVLYHSICGSIFMQKTKWHI